MKIAFAFKHIAVVFRRLYFYARNLRRYLHDRSCVIIQPCNSTAVSVCININDFFVLWFRFIGKNNFSSTIWYFIVKTASVDERKCHLFRPQIQITGQLNLRHAVIRNLYFLRKCLITVPSNPGPYRFFITSLHNLPGRVINYHILIGPVGKFKSVPMERDGISLRAFTRFFGT